MLQAAARAGCSRLTCRRCFRRTWTSKHWRCGKDAARANGAAAVREPCQGGVRAGHAPLDRRLQVSRTTATNRLPPQMRGWLEISAPDIPRPSWESGTRTALLQPELPYIPLPEIKEPHPETRQPQALCQPPRNPETLPDTLTQPQLPLHLFPRPPPLHPSSQRLTLSQGNLSTLLFPAILSPLTSPPCPQTRRSLFCSPLPLSPSWLTPHPPSPSPSPHSQIS